MRRMIAFALMGVAAFVFYPTPANADSITLLSASGGIYDYNVLITSAQVTWSSNPAIVFSGASGVFSVGVFPGTSNNTLLSNCFTPFVTPTTVTFNLTPPAVGCVYNNPSTSTLVGTIEIRSTSLTLGPVSYNSNSVPGFSGTVMGPVAASPVPEPSTILLLGTGLVGLMGKALRRKWLA